MDRGAWWATVHGVTEWDMTEATESVRVCARAHTHTHTHTHPLLGSMGTELRDRPPGWSGGGSVSRTRGQL